MALAEATQGIGRKEITRILGQVRNLNRQRLQRIHDGIQPWQRIVVELLPLLYHVNHPLLPGFVGSEAPCGLADYRPSHDSLHAARSLSKSFTWKKRAYRSYPLTGLYLMGSIGSIGQSNESDLDVWLCHRPELNRKQRAHLRAKAAAIESWAAGLGLEMHTFLIDPSRFRDGQRDALSNESSGATQPLLLLEEFYRSAVWLAGHFPLWWLIAPEHENDYRRHARWLIEQRFVDAREWLDLGGLEHIDAAEFFGAAQWQLYKGLASPYKSVLKLLLIETFSADFPRIDWLALDIKRAIWRGHSDADYLDPYLLMYRRIEAHLQRLNETTRLELIRRCLYIKADIRLGNEHEREDWRTAAWHALCAEWGWRDSEIRHIDAHREWKADQVQHETRLLIDELSRGYRQLRDFARRHGAAELCESSEFELLGKKLRTAFETRAGKIERLNPRISEDLSEPRLALRHHEEQGWLLYRNPPGGDERPPGSPLKAAPQVLELLLWCRANHVCTPATQWDLDETLNASETRALLASLARMTFIDRRDTDIEALARPPLIEGCALLVNVGLDPLAHLTERGLQLTSDRCDPLGFGSTRINLVHTIDCIQSNSWGELLVTRHEGAQGLLGLLCDFLGARAPNVGPVRAWSHSSPRGAAIARRVEALFQQLATLQAPRWRHVLRIAERIHIVHHDQGDYRWTEQADLDELIDALGAPLPGPCQTFFDTEFGDETPLPFIHAHQREEQLQLFYQDHGDCFEYWLLDERGALFHGTQWDIAEQHFVTHQRRFLDNLTLRRQLDSGRTRLDLAPGIHKLRRDRGQWRATRCDVMAENLAVDFLPLELLGINEENQHLQLLFDRRIYDSIALGDDFYPAVTRAVLAARRARESYPIYLTGIAKNPSDRLPDTIELMRRKTRIERRLNQALRSL